MSPNLGSPGLRGARFQAVFARSNYVEIGWNLWGFLPHFLPSDPDVGTKSSALPEGYGGDTHLRGLRCGPRSARWTAYHRSMSGQRVPGGVVHKLPADLRKALIVNATALNAWKDITPLARNEFICWVEDAKKEITRERRIRRTQEELEEGQRRPCCWPGCKHRERTGK